MTKIEYRVRPVTRYIVTRHHESEDGRTGGSVGKGEFDNYDTAYAVAYALCKEEHHRLGYPLDDERIKYPEPIYSCQIGGASIASTDFKMPIMQTASIG